MRIYAVERITTTREALLVRASSVADATELAVAHAEHPNVEHQYLIGTNRKARVTETYPDLQQPNLFEDP